MGRGTRSPPIPVADARLELQVVYSASAEPWSPRPYLATAERVDWAPVPDRADTVPYSPVVGDEGIAVAVAGTGLGTTEAPPTEPAHVTVRIAVPGWPMIGSATVVTPGDEDAVCREQDGTVVLRAPSPEDAVALPLRERREHR